MSAADYDKNKKWCRWNGVTWNKITSRMEEEEEEYNLFLQQALYKLGARGRECAAAYAEAERFRKRKVQKETKRRDQIAAKAASKRAKKEAEGNAEVER